MTAANNDASPMDGAPVIDFDKFKPTRSFTSARKRKDFAMKALISCAFIVALIPLFSVLLTTIINGVKRLNLNFLSYNMTGVVGGNPTPVRRLRRHPARHHRHAGNHLRRHAHLHPDRPDVRRVPGGIFPTVASWRRSSPCWST